MPPSPVATSRWKSGGDSCELLGSGEGNGAGSDAPPRSRSPRSAPQGDGRPSPARAGRPGCAPAGDPRRVSLERRSTPPLTGEGEGEGSRASTRSPGRQVASPPAARFTRRRTRGRRGCFLPAS
ncbi:hypothetical protein J1605_005203 [Eschrichtius robustus]|uniref:Uncharacterized protein n=1 Tax=Eschrichtius robustus TaxID=9764 RepID=A0AB34HAM4_ESCRO|nr:hypothetical protein J1605_005203 [Eschrichtius robustus]